MNSIVVNQREFYCVPEYDRQQIMAYMGMGGAKGGDADSVQKLIDECIAECEAANVFSYKVCFCILPAEITEDSVSAGVIDFKSRSLAKHISGCRKIVIFAATVGIGIDRLIGKYSMISPSKALVFQSIGAERIESLCDTFCSDTEIFCGDGNHCPKSRFSPGYGDFAIEAQTDIFRLLDCSKKIGVSLCDSMLMSPTKSVTAIVGIY